MTHQVKEPLMTRRPSWRASLDDELAGDRSQEHEHNVLHFESLIAPVSIGFNRCFFFCSFLASIPGVLVVLMFSEIGFGKEVHDAFAPYGDHTMSVLAALAGFCVFLYLIDFYFPPHIHRVCTFFEHDNALPLLVFALKGALIFLFGLFDSRDNPIVPVLLTCLLGPVLLVGAHSSWISESQLDESSLTRRLGGGKLDGTVKTEIISSFVADIRQSRVFWAAAMTALIISGMAIAGVWFAWSLANGGHVRDIVQTRKDAREYVRWLAPAVAGVANILFGLTIAVRVHISEVYEKSVRATAEMTVVANEFTLKHGGSKFHHNFAEFQDVLREQEAKAEGRVSVSKTSSRDSGLDLHTVKDEWLKWVLQKDSFTKQLASVLKVVFCILFVMAGCLNATTALVSISGQFANVFLNLLTLVAVNLLIVLWTICGRLSNITKEWIVSLPLWRMGMSIVETTWFKAVVLVGVGPVVPFFCLLSMLNQSVRRRRTVYGRMNPAKQPMSHIALRRLQPKPLAAWEERTTVALQDGDQWLTKRVRDTLRNVSDWDWVTILRQAYIVGFAFSLYTLSPRLLNICLAALIYVLSTMPFWAVFIATIVTGIICFLLPPVPGVPVYLFTGLVIAGTFPGNYVLGCGIAVLTSYIMKLIACAIQQVAIGGGLGRSSWIKAQVGVNKPLIRAIEVVLKRPGLTLPKVAIACGGPDWPTSVLAGLVGVSLVTMEVATIPVIFFLGPCTVSGAFYLRREESEEWGRWASLMLNFTVVSALLQQLVAAWAIQEVLEKQTVEVSKPLEKNIDLDWIDFKSQELANAIVIRWKDLNIFFKFILIVGLSMEVLTAQLFYWRASDCFGEFSVSDDIKTLKLIGADGVLKDTALLGLGCAVVGFILYAFISCVVGRKRASTVAKRRKQLAAYEARWRAARLRLARQAAKSWPPPEADLHAIAME